MPRVLGIDIGSDALRGALVRSTMRRVEVEKTLSIPLTQAVGSPGRLVELTEGVQALLGAVGAPPDTVIASMPGDRASLRVVTLPASVAKRIAEVVPFEIEALLPFGLDDAVLDYQRVDARGETLRVLVAAVPSEHVRALLAELATVGIDPRELAVGAVALEGLVALVPELADEASVLLVELAEERTELCVLERGHCASARTISIGTRHLPASLDLLGRELRHSLAAHQAAGGKRPTRALSCGVGAGAPSANAWLAREIQCPVEPVTLPAPIGGGLPPGPASARAVALGALAALGSRRINLRQGAFAPARGAARLAEHARLLAICVAIVAMAATFALKSEQALLADERRALRSELAALTKEAFGKTTTDPVEAEAWVTSRKVDDPLPRFDAFDAFAAISSAVAPEIEHELRRLRVDLADEKREGTLELQGTLSSIEERDAIIRALTEHACFGEIEPGRVTPAGGKDRINYQIEAVVRCPGEAPPEGKKRGGAH